MHCIGPEGKFVQPVYMELYDGVPAGTKPTPDNIACTDHCWQGFCKNPQAGTGFPLKFPHCNPTIAEST